MVYRVAPRKLFPKETRKTPRSRRDTETKMNPQGNHILAEGEAGYENSFCLQSPPGCQALCWAKSHTITFHLTTTQGVGVTRIPDLQTKKQAQGARLLLQVTQLDLLPGTHSILLSSMNNAEEDLGCPLVMEASPGAGGQ